jgi:hypothetical protein
MDLQTLHTRTGISKRKLRYCVDHHLVPRLGIELAEDEAGRPRKFADDVGFGIVCAAHLLDLGLPHERIRYFLESLLQIQLGVEGEPKPALIAIFERNANAGGFLGDGVNVRLAAPDFGYDSGWRAPAGAAPLRRRYEPVVTVTLNLGKIVAAISG